MNTESKIRFYVFIFIGLLLITAIGCVKKTVLPPLPKTNPDTLLFIDTVNNDTIKTVKIGTQLWMAENLRATKYRNGKPIIYIQDDTSKWRTDTLGAYCYSEGKSINLTPGLLYNWYAVNNPNQLAPEGWHIATDEDWKTLETTLGMSAAAVNDINWRGTNEADMLKTQSKKQYGQYPNWDQYDDSKIWSTNTSGFTAMPGGCRIPDGRWSDEGNGIGFWWTATADPNNSKKALYRYLDYKKTNVFRNTLSKSYGCSVRCVHD